MACDQDMEREHYDKSCTIAELFCEDRAALTPLPSVPSDTARNDSTRTDKYGRFTLENGQHHYSVSPAFCDSEVMLRITSSEVKVMDTAMHEIVSHRCLYGAGELESKDWLPYLKYIQGNLVLCSASASMISCRYLCSSTCRPVRARTAAGS